MSWKSIRLELGRTADFPDGSPSRTYLLRLPLDQENLIDEHALKAAPALATVHRYWPNEPDMIGNLIRSAKCWAISYEPDEGVDEAVFHLEILPLQEGNYVTLTEPDGRRLPFRVASVRPMT
jgi:hypothetical protein